MRRFELVEGTSAKFWQITVAGDAFTVAWGRLGTAGQSQIKSFADAGKAQAEADKLVREKTAKGYREVAPGASPGAAAPAPVKAAPAPPAPAPPAPAPPASAAPPPAPPAERPPPAEQPPAEPPLAAAAATVDGAGLADDRPIAWSATSLALCPALPGHPVAPPPDDVQALWDAMRRDRSAIGINPVRLAFLERLGVAGAAGLLERTEPPAAGTPQENARYFAFFSGDGRVADLLALQGGLQQALASLLAATEIREQVAKWQNTDLGAALALAPWLALRRRLLAAPPEEMAAARELAAARYGGAPKHLQCRIALLFPGEPWARQLVAEAIALPSVQHQAFGVSCLLLDAGSLAETADAIPRLRLFEISHWAGLGLTEGLLARHGAAGAELLAALHDTGIYSPELRDEILAAWAQVPTRDAFLALLERFHQRELGAFAREALPAHPGPGLVALADYAGRRAKNTESVLPLLRSLVRQHPAIAAAAALRASAAGAALLRRQLEEASRPLPWASPESWPPVLAAPPWERSGRGPAAEATLPLETLGWDERMTWEEGEQESWRARRGSSHDLQEVLRRFRLDAAGLAAAAAGDPAQRAALSGQRQPSSLLALLEPRQALALFVLEPPIEWMVWWGGFEAFLADTELAPALPALLRLTVLQPQLQPLLLPADSPRLAPRMAQLLRRHRRQAAFARTWLRRHPRAAVTGLVPPALGADPAVREDALEALRYLAASGWRGDLLAIAGEYGVAAEIEAQLDRDPLELAPAKAPKAPAFWDPAGLPPLRLVSGEALPAAAIERLRAMLAFTRHDRPYAGLAQVRSASDRGSLAEFAWSLFQSWLAAGAPAKEQWAMMSLGHLGDDSCARRLAPLIRTWPGEAAHARAVAGLEVLTLIGSDVALMLLQAIADKVKFKGLQDHARQKIEEIADQRGLSAEELADRLAPDLGLGEDGSLELDFGPRRFRVAFDEQLRPFVLDAEGKRLGDLPKPNKADDATASAAAVETWKALKKDAKSLAGLQIFRLERAMANERRFPRRIFEDFFAHHPLVRHLARRLVWAAHQGERASYFRIAEDGTYTDAGDEAWLLPEDCEISVPHAIAAPPVVFEAFAGIFADYELLQPFPQLGRQAFELSPEQQRLSKLLEWSGRSLPTGKLLGLEKLGWRRGAPQDAGLTWWYEKELPGGVAFLNFHDGIAAGDIDWAPTQTLDELELRRSAGFDQQAVPFAALSRVAASELLRDVEGLLS